MKNFFSRFFPELCAAVAAGVILYFVQANFNFGGNRAEEYFLHGNEQFDAKNFDGAIAAYDEAIRLEPKYTEAYRRRADIYYQQKNYAAAAADYTQAIRLGTNEAIVYENRGDCIRAGD